MTDKNEKITNREKNKKQIACEVEPLALSPRSSGTKLRPSPDGSFESKYRDCGRSFHKQSAFFTVLAIYSGWSIHVRKRSIHVG